MAGAKLAKFRGMSRKNRIPRVSSGVLLEMMRANQVVVLDVRNAEEFEDGHVFGALHAPVESLPKAAERISKSASLVVVSNRGTGRCEQAARALIRSSWKNTLILEGGYIDWVDSGFPTYQAGLAAS